MIRLKQFYIYVRSKMSYFYSLLCISLFIALALTLTVFGYAQTYIAAKNKGVTNDDSLKCYSQSNLSSGANNYCLGALQISLQEGIL